MLTSIMDYKERGKWGDSRYRGNCSGYVIKNLLEHYRPAKPLELFAGGGTGYEVMRDLGFRNSLHLDLNPRWGGFNALSDEIPEGSDFIFAHPPYHDIIKYSGEMWGTKPHPDDLSRCNTYDEFIKKLDLIHAKLYASLRTGGRMAILVGDCRRKGEYFSIIKDMTYIGKLEAHLIKVQHNTFSANTQYTGKFIPILHEHLVIFLKPNVWLVPVTVTLKRQQDLKHYERITWRDLVQASMEELGGTATMEQLYKRVEGTKKAQQNKHWKEKIRQTLQIFKDFEPVGRGEWKLADWESKIA